MAALVARESHDNDLFEVRNRGDAHSHLAFSGASVAVCRELQSPFPDLVASVDIIVDRLGEVHASCLDLGVRMLVGVDLHLADQLILFLFGSLDRLIAFFEHGFNSLDSLRGKLVLLGHERRLVNIVAHGLVLFNGTLEFVHSEARVGNWRVGVLNETIAGRIVHFEGERQNFALHVLAELCDKIVDLLSSDGVKLASL